MGGGVPANFSGPKRSLTLSGPSVELKGRGAHCATDWTAASQGWQRRFPGRAAQGLHGEGGEEIRRGGRRGEAADGAAAPKRQKTLIIIIIAAAPSCARRAGGGGYSSS